MVKDHINGKDIEIFNATISLISFFTYLILIMYIEYLKKAGKLLQ